MKFSSTVLISVSLLIMLFGLMAPNYPLVQLCFIAIATAFVCGFD